MDPLRIAARVLVAYAVALILIRLAGHRSIGQMNLASFIVALVIGDLFDNFFFDEIPLGTFVTAVGTIFLVHLTASAQLRRSGARLFRRGIE